MCLFVICYVDFILELCYKDFSKLVQPPLRIDTAKFYAAEFLQALSHLHTHGIIHRDLKPENLFLAYDGHLRIGDLGSAIFLDSDDYRRGINISSICFFMVFPSF